MVVEVTAFAAGMVRARTGPLQAGFAPQTGAGDAGHVARPARGQQAKLVPHFGATGESKPRPPAPGECARIAQSGTALPGGSYSLELWLTMRSLLVLVHSFSPHCAAGNSTWASLRRFRRMVGSCHDDELRFSGGLGEPGAGRAG